MLNRLILISSSDISRGVYESHVISLLKFLKRSYDIKLALVSFLKPKLSKDEKEIFDNRLNELDSFIGKENILFFNDRGFFELIKQKRAIESFIADYKDENIFLFCQNYYAGFLGCLIKKRSENIYLHVDFKGLVPEEHLLYDDSFILKRFLLFVSSKLFERYIFKYADSVSTVSHNFKQHFQSKYVIGERPFLVLPSAVDGDRFFYDEELRRAYRQKLGYDNLEIIITYSGSFQKWQQPERIFEFFKQASTLKEFKFLVLTFDREQAKRFAKEYSLPEERIQIFTASPAEVNGYLNASDICLLLRKDDIVNNVASPTKFGEYLVTKNKIIISKRVGDFSEMVDKSEYGICLESLNLDSSEIIKRIEKKRIPTDEEINKFKREYSIEKNIEKLGELIEREKCNTLWGQTRTKAVYIKRVT